MGARAVLAFLLVLASFAGCVEPAKSQAASSSNPVHPAESVTASSAGLQPRFTPVANATPTRSLRASYDLETSDVTTPLIHVHQDVNCVTLPGPIQAISGTVTVTWEPQSLMTEQLELQVYDSEKTSANLEGRSPLVAVLDNVTVNGTEWHQGLHIAAELNELGVSAGQAFTMTLDLVYQAPEPLKVEENWSCSWG